MDYTLVFRSIIQRKSVTDAQPCVRECDLHRSIYECQAFAFTPRSTFDNCLLSNVYGLSLDSILETSYGWDVWTYGGVIFPSVGNRASSSLQQQAIFSVSGRECQ